MSSIGTIEGKEYVIYCTSNEKYMFIEYERERDGTLEYRLKWITDWRTSSFLDEIMVDALLDSCREAFSGVVVDGNWYYFAAMNFLIMLKDDDIASLDELMLVPMEESSRLGVDFVACEKLFEGFYRE